MAHNKGGGGGLTQIEDDVSTIRGIPELGQVSRSSVKVVHRDSSLSEITPGHRLNQADISVADRDPDISVSLAQRPPVTQKEDIDESRKNKDVKYEQRVQQLPEMDPYDQLKFTKSHTNLKPLFQPRDPPSQQPKSVSSSTGIVKRKGSGSVNSKRSVTITSRASADKSWQKKFAPYALLFSYFLTFCIASQAAVGRSVNSIVMKSPWENLEFSILIAFLGVYGAVVADAFFGRLALYQYCSWVNFLCLCVSVIFYAIDKRMYTAYSDAVLYASSFMIDTIFPVLLGDQASDSPDRIFLYILRKLILQVTFLVAWAFKHSVEETWCPGDLRCMTFLYMSAAIVVMMKNILICLGRKHITQQHIIRGNVVTRGWKCFKYGFEMKRKSEGGKGLLKHAEEIDVDMAKGIQRIVRSLWLVPLVLAYFFTYHIVDQEAMSQAAKSDTTKLVKSLNILHEHDWEIIQGVIHCAVLISVAVLTKAKLSKFSHFRFLSAAFMMLGVATIMVVHTEVVQRSKYQLGDTETDVTIVNKLSCDVSAENASNIIATVQSGKTNKFKVGINQHVQLKSLPHCDVDKYTKTAYFLKRDIDNIGIPSGREGVFMVLYRSENGSIALRRMSYKRDREPHIARVLVNSDHLQSASIWCNDHHTPLSNSTTGSLHINFENLSRKTASKFSITIKSNKKTAQKIYTTLELHAGGTYGVAIANGVPYTATLVDPYSSSAVLPVITLVFLAVSQILFLLTTFEFFYNQAPAQMRCIMLGLGIFFLTFIDNHLADTLYRWLLGMVTADRAVAVLVATLISLLFLAPSLYKLTQFEFKHEEQVYPQSKPTYADQIIWCCTDRMSK